MFKSIFVRVVVVLTFFAVNSAPTALAQESTPTSTATATPTATPADILAFEIYPKDGRLGDFFNEEIEPGASKDLTVVIANTGTVDFEGRSYAINAVSAINGGFSIVERGTEANATTQWLDYPEETYTIKPRTGVERTFTVTVPENAEPGQHVTALALENAEAQPIEGSENFQQITRFAVPILITVPGPIEPSFEIGDITLNASNALTEVSVEIRNTGNIRVRPAGDITISDGSGNPLYGIPVSMGSVYARDATLILIGLPQQLPQGEYQISVVLEDSDTAFAASVETTVSISTAATPIAALPVQIVNATAAPQPAVDNVQFLDITAIIENSGEPLTNVRVVLRTTLDGESVEDFPLSTSLALPVGQTPIQSRYIPATGWTAGTWSFELSVEVVDPTSGSSRVLSTTPLVSVEIP